MHPQDPAAAIKALEGCEFGYVYLEPTDKLGADVPNPKSHICYGFATHVVILDDDGRVSEVYAAHDSGKVVNPISIQGQIEGGVLMRLPRTGRSRTAYTRQGTVRLGCSVRPRFRISTPSTWRRTSCCPWHTAARASARLQRSPRRPPCRTPIARLMASCVRICPWWIRPTAASVTAARVGRGRPLLTDRPRLTSTVYAVPSIAPRSQQKPDPSFEGPGRRHWII